MSTYFGIKVPGYEKPVEVAFRYGKGKGKIGIDILNPLVLLLPDETPLIALDNTSQGIETVKDLKNEGKISEMTLY